MKVVTDTYIPFLADYLAKIATPSPLQIVSLPPEQITASVVQDADALFVRTRTQVNQTLLDKSIVRFVATATIGTDHLDTKYLDQQGISWVSAPGCNAQAVCDYIEAALDEVITPYIAAQHHSPSLPLTIGIVGCGHVGGKVLQMATQKGLKVLVNDPLKGFDTPLSQIARQADIITFHTPLTFGGKYKTYHMCNAAFLSACRPNTFIINAARGGIVDEFTLLKEHHSKHIQYILDTWENEPHINTQVLRHALTASFHIAGYSLDGKINASQQVLDAFCRFFHFPTCTINKKAVPSRLVLGDSARDWLQRITEQLQAHPEEFETLRKNYLLR